LNVPPKPGEVSAAALLLSILGRHLTMQVKELLSLAGRRGLRGGALPLAAGVTLLKAAGLIAGDSVVIMTPPGRSCLDVLGSGEEPTDLFRDLLTALSFGTKEARLVLANVRVEPDGLLSDPRGIADPVFEHLAAAGVIEPAADGAWRLQKGRGAILLGGMVAANSEPSEAGASIELGDRGESLSMRYEFERVREWPLQVSKISSSFGYDLESVSRKGASTKLAVEVKATSGLRLLINWSANEARTALLLQNSCVLHIWGEVDLARTVDDDYVSLIAKGYPLIVRNPGELAREVIADAAHWKALKHSRISTSNFLWEFWTNR
jgi:Domain of unknown function (DUF3883)